MASNSKPNAVVYTALPANSNSISDDQNYVLLPFYPRRRRPHHCFSGLLSLSAVIVLSLAVFILWPSDPTLRVVRVKLNHIKVKTSPTISLDLSVDLTIRVRNRDFFSLNYDSLSVAIGYRGKELGFVESDGGRLKARGSSYVDATLSVDGFEVLHDLFYLIEDIASGSVPFDTVSVIGGRLGLFFVKIPIQAQVSCEVFVNPLNQTIIHQNCYPE